jgi:hypothetical protein
MPGSKNYSNFLISSGEIPAGSDAGKFFPLFSAPNKSAVEIHYVQYYGGDASEAVMLILVPPTVVINGTTGPSDHPGTIAITPNGYMGDTVFTQNSPEALGSQNGGRGSPRFEKFVVPANYQVAVMQNTANSAAWYVTVGGFEIDA